MVARAFVPVAICAVVLTPTAFAAGFGCGVTPSGLGAANTVVVSCDTDGVDLSFVSTYSPTSGLYVLSSVTIAGLDPACIGATAEVTVAGAAGIALASLSAPVTSGSVTFAVSGTPVPASSVLAVAVVVQ